MTIKKSYYAIIPAEVRYAPDLPANAKLLYGEITALCNQSGYCFASNEYFSKLYAVDDRTVRRWIQALEKEEFIYSKVSGKKRKIFLSPKLAAKMPDIEDDDEDREEEEATAPAPRAKKKAKKVAAKKAVVVKEKKWTDEDLMLAEMLLSKIILNFPLVANRRVNISEWAEDIRKLREIDEATPEQIEFMIAWVQGGEVIRNGKTLRFAPHEFWAGNIMSAAKLRKQWFENLIPKLHATYKKEEAKTAVAVL